MSGHDKRGLIFGKLQEELQSQLESAADYHFLEAQAGLNDLQDVSCLVLADKDGQYLQNAQAGLLGVLDAVPEGLCVTNEDFIVLWHNEIFRRLISADADQPLLQSSIPNLLQAADDNTLEQLAPPSAKGLSVRYQFRRENGAVLALRISRLPADQKNLLVTLTDVSAEMLLKQKHEAIYRAGLELGNLSPDDVASMTPEERVALLTDQILQLTQEVLGYDRFELRLLNPESSELEPLLEFGMSQEAAERQLFSSESGNGVTGFVAFSGQSYLCVDTKSDPLYLSGASDARSSLTVPLMIRDTVLGTFNVESQGTLAFDQQDLDFFVLFSRVVASALNQLQLLEVEKTMAATANTDRLRREVAEPSDEILKATTWILERYIGHDPDVCERLHLIADRIRRIASNVGNVEENQSGPGLKTGIISRPPRQLLKGQRVLVVDQDAIAREDAHNLLGQMGCQVEAVQTATDARSMLRNYSYDVILMDINLSDASGYECFSQLRQINPSVPIIMMTSFGYDSTHSIIRARQEGMKAVLFKPFRRAQMLDELEKALTPANAEESKDG